MRILLPGLFLALLAATSIYGQVIENCDEDDCKLAGLERAMENTLAAYRAQNNEPDIFAANARTFISLGKITKLVCVFGTLLVRQWNCDKKASSEEEDSPSRPQYPPPSFPPLFPPSFPPSFPPPNQPPSQLPPTCIIAPPGSPCVSNDGLTIIVENIKVPAIGKSELLTIAMEMMITIEKKGSHKKKYKKILPQLQAICAQAVKDGVQKSLISADILIERINSQCGEYGCISKCKKKKKKCTVAKLLSSMT